MVTNLIIKPTPDILLFFLILCVCYVLDQNFNNFVTITHIEGGKKV